MNEKDKLPNYFSVPDGKVGALCAYRICEKGESLTKDGQFCYSDKVTLLPPLRNWKSWNSFNAATNFNLKTRYAYEYIRTVHWDFSMGANGDYMAVEICGLSGGRNRNC